MNLTEMDDAGKQKFKDKIAELKPQGYTYHDSGMAWGRTPHFPHRPFRRRKYHGDEQASDQPAHHLHDRRCDDDAARQFRTRARNA